MKYLFLFICLSILTLDSNAQYSAQEDFAEHFLKAIKAEIFDSLKILMPTAEVYRAISPEETQDKTDEELTKYIEVHEKRIEKQFKRVLGSAKKEKLKLEKLKYYEVETEFLPIQPFIFFSMHLYFSYKKQKGFFVLSTVNYDNNWYLLKILNSRDIFELILDR